MKEITPQETHALGDTATIIDVREHNELAEVRLENATHIPLHELADRVDEVPEGAIIMCHAGGRSARAVDYLNRLGRDATNLVGGISDWEAAGLPTARS